MIDIINPDRKVESEDYDLFDEDTDIAGLLHAKAKRKTKNMTTESVCRIFTFFYINILIFRP